MEYGCVEAPDKKQLLTPTEIGQEIGASGRVVNKLLQDLGYQHKVGDKWEVLEDGNYYAVMLDTNKRHSDVSPVRQLKWQSSIIEVLRNYLIEEDG